MPSRYTAEVRHAGRDVHVTMRVTVSRGPYRSETLRVGKGFFQPRLWSETIAPLLWASGWVITTADGVTLDPAKLDLYLHPGADGPPNPVTKVTEVPENTGKHPALTPSGS